MSPINIPINLDDANEGANSFLDTFNSIISATNNEAEDLRLITKELSSSVEQANNLLTLGKDFQTVIGESKSLVDQLAISLQTAAQSATAPIKNLLQLINEAQRGLAALGGTPSDFAGFASQFGGPRAPQDVTASPDFSTDSDSRAYQPRSRQDVMQSSRRSRQSSSMLDELVNIESNEVSTLDTIEDQIEKGQVKLPKYGNSDFDVIRRGPGSYQPTINTDAVKNLKTNKYRQMLKERFPGVEPYISDEQLRSGRVASVAYQETMNRLASASSLFGRRGRKAFRIAKNIANLVGYNYRGLSADERGNWVTNADGSEEWQPTWQHDDDPTKQSPLLRFANKFLGGLDSIIGRPPGRGGAGSVSGGQMSLFDDVASTSPTAAAGGSRGGGGGGFINGVVQGEWDHFPGMGGSGGDLEKLLGNLGQVKDILSNPIVSAGLVLTAGVYGYRGLHQLAQTARGITGYAQQTGNMYGTVDYSRTAGDTIHDFFKSGLDLNPFYSFADVQAARQAGASIVGYKGGALNQYIDTSLKMQQLYGMNAQQFGQYAGVAANFGMGTNDVSFMLGQGRNISAGTNLMTTSYADQAALTGAGTFMGLGATSNVSSILGAQGVTAGIGNKVLQGMGGTGYELMGTMYGQAMMAQGLGTDINNLAGALQKSSATQIANLNTEMMINLLTNLGIPVDKITGQKDPRIETLTLMITLQSLGVPNITNVQKAAAYVWPFIKAHQNKQAYDLSIKAKEDQKNGIKKVTMPTRYGTRTITTDNSQKMTQDYVMSNHLTQKNVDADRSKYKDHLAGIEGADTIWNREKEHQLSELYKSWKEYNHTQAAMLQPGIASEQDWMNRNHIKVSIEGTQFATLRAATQSTYKSYTNGDIPPSRQPTRG
jgi:hypothetical protein